MSAITAPHRPKIQERLSGTISPTKRKLELGRVDLVGRMDDRHRQYLAAGDRRALLELAGEYFVLGNHGGCPTLANKIILECDNL